MTDSDDSCAFIPAGNEPSGRACTDSKAGPGWLLNAVRVNTPPLGALQIPCPAACGGVIDSVGGMRGNREMRLLYGTGNPAKLAAMRQRLSEMEIELIGLQDLKAEGIAIPAVPEDGSTPLENARQKAAAYYEAFHMPVFSCDSGLYFEHVPDEVQPGVHVRNVNGSCLSDEQMLEYYSGLAKKYGRLVAKYKNAICLVMDENHIYEAMEPSMESERFLITDVPHSAIRKKGFPLDSLSIDIKTNQYYYDLPASALDQVAVEDGFLLFFQKVFRELPGA